MRGMKDPLNGLVGTRSDGVVWVRVSETRHEECGACECGIAFEPEAEDIRRCLALAVSRSKAAR